jgi:hypothetical protein
MNKFVTFIIGIVLGLIVGGGLILYFISPRGNATPRGVVIQPPDPQGTAPGTAALQLKQEFFTPVIQALFNGENSLTFPLSLTGQTVEQPVNEITCGKITLKSEGSGVATAVRMENGQILIPLAFTGNVYAFGSCLNFNGWSESGLQLRFDEKEQIVFGQIDVQTVNLEGVSPVVSALLTPLVQSTINNRFNPVEILRGEKIALKVPVKSTQSNLLGKVKDVRAEVKDGLINLYITYDFTSEKQVAEPVQ